MGQEQVVRSARSLIDAMTDLGPDAAIVMVDANLVMPTAPPPSVWNEVRLKTAAGMITLRRHGTDVALVVFGNATPALLAMRDRIAAALAGVPV
jgi:hypothetical protein